MKFKSKSYALTIIIGAILASAVHAQEAEITTVTIPLDAMTEARRNELLQRISEEANQVANKKSYFEVDMRPIDIRVSYDLQKNVVVFDLDERFGPEVGWTEMGDMIQSITERIKGITPLLDFGRSQLWLFGGKDSEFWMADPETEAMPGPRGASRVRRDATGASGNALVVAAGHGLYYHHGFKKWTTHRERVNGILEDETTVKLSEALMFYLAQSQIRFEAARSRSYLLDYESQFNWSELGARYHLKAIMPDHPEVWNSLNGSNDPGRERREDIKSRPLYANQIGAGAILHLHTNADDSSAARGTRVFVFPGRAEDKILAELTLCSMKSVIHSVERFKSFPVADRPGENAFHAENKYAKMPSVIVETAFHSNVEDAELLKDAEFRRVAMKGVAKGYRLYLENQGCKKFELTEAAVSIATQYKPIYADFDVSGNFFYPLELRYLRLNCETCRARREYIGNADNLKKIRLAYMCKTSDVDGPPVKFQAVAIDVYGVATEPKSFEFSCKRAS